MEIKDLMKSINVTSNDIKPMAEFFKIGRFDNGLKNLEYVIKLSNLVNQCKQAFKANKWKDNLSTIIGIEYKKLYDKNDSGAVSKIADLDHKALKEWYIKENKFMVSPRSILKGFNDSTADKKPEKTELEKILQTLTTLDSQSQNYKLTELEIGNVKSQLKAVTAIINKMVATDKLDKVA